MAKAKAAAKAAKSKENSKASEGAATPMAGVPVTAEAARPPSVLLANTGLLDGTEGTDEVVLTDAEGRRHCRSTDCDQIGVVDGYCRYHYLFYWRKIQNRKKVLADGELERYIEELTVKYADIFIELLRKDLRTEKDFQAAIQELELDDTSQSAEEDDKTYLEEIRGMGAEEGGGRSDEDF